MQIQPKNDSQEVSTPYDLAHIALRLAYLGFNTYFHSLDRCKEGVKNVIEPIRRLGDLNLEYLTGRKKHPDLPKHPALPPLPTTPYPLSEISMYRLPALRMSYNSLTPYFEHPRAKLNPYDESLQVLYGLADTNIHHLKFLLETSNNLFPHEESPHDPS